MGYKPTVIHTEDRKGRLCRLEKTSSWAEKYLNDKFAQTLPPCQGCLDETIRRGWKVPKRWESSMTKPQPIDDLFADTPVYEDDEISYSNNDEQMSLREWCE
jgi:hypothetical protein